MKDHDPNRRNFLTGSLILTGVAGAGAVLWAAGKYFSRGALALSSRAGHVGVFESPDNTSGANPALTPKKNPDGTYEVSAEAVPNGGFAIAAIAGAPLILVRSGECVRVFNATCTHLGCLVKWDPAQNQFLCPCHGGVYDADGNVLAGPPPAKLCEHQAGVSEGKVTIALA